MKTTELKFYLAGTILITVIFLVVIEITTRVISWGRGDGFTLALHEFDAYDDPIKSVYSWHPFTGFTFKPNTKLKGSHPNQNFRSEVLIDEYGFLTDGQKFTYTKQKDEIRIAFIGASTTANVNLSYSQNWPGHLGEMVKQVLPSKNIKIINAAVPGFDTAQSIGNLSLRVLPFNPDIVIIYHAYNDLKAVVADPANFKPDYSHIHTLPYGFHKEPILIKRIFNHSMAYVRLRNGLREYRRINGFHTNDDALGLAGRQNQIPDYATKTFEEHIRTMVYMARSGGAKVILSSFATLHDPNLDYSNKETLKKLSTRQLNELSSLTQFTPGLSVQGIFNGINSYNKILKRISEEEHTGWVDNANLVSHTDDYFVDRVHFSSKGATKMAENFFPVVNKDI